MLSNIFFFLFTHFTAGLLATILLISLSEIGKLFFRVTTLVGVFLLLLAIFSKPFGNVNLGMLPDMAAGDVTFWQQITYLSFIGTAVLLLLYNLVMPRMHKLLISTATAVCFAGVALHALVSPPALVLSGSQRVFAVLNDLVSACLLGSVLGAMITGHWYLVQHKLSLVPLKRSSIFFLSSVFAKLIMLAIGFVIFQTFSLDAATRGLFNGDTFNSWIFILRIAVGLAIPLIFAFMIWSSVKIRSTQSATGILYATIVLILIGETFARYLSFSEGIPL